jgi:hypothetical protein
MDRIWFFWIWLIWSLSKIGTSCPGGCIYVKKDNCFGLIINWFWWLFSNNVKIIVLSLLLNLSLDWTSHEWLLAILGYIIIKALLIKIKRIFFWWPIWTRFIILVLNLVILKQHQIPCWDVKFLV